MLSNKKEVLWAATHSGVQTAAAGNNTRCQKRTIVLALNIVVTFSLISTRTPYWGRATVCVRINRQVVAVKGSVYLEWTIGSTVPEKSAQHTKRRAQLYSCVQTQLHNDTNVNRFRSSKGLSDDRTLLTLMKLRVTDKSLNMRRVDKFKCLQAKCREKPWKSPGSNLRHQIA